jgi:hypothetical protein
MTKLILITSDGDRTLQRSSTEKNPMVGNKFNQLECFSAALFQREFTCRESDNTLVVYLEVFLSIML